MTVIPKRIQKYLEFNERFLMLSDRLKRFEDCKEVCPLFQIFQEYMRSVAEDGRIEMIKSQAKKIKELNSKLQEQAQ
jgi:hypothetical protein